jgi:hypothetical protein
MNAGNGAYSQLDSVKFILSRLGRSSFFFVSEWLFTMVHMKLSFWIFQIRDVTTLLRAKYLIKT